MAQEPPSGSLPSYYGERMQDGTMVESPRPRPSDSHDALLRLPIEPGEAHLQHEHMSPISPISAGDAFGINSGIPPGSTSKRTGSDPNRWVSYPRREKVEDYRQGSRRSDGYGPSDYRGPVSHRTPYVEEYSDEEERPRAYQRPQRRHTRPPPSHGRMIRPDGPYWVEQGRRNSESRRVSFDYESDTPAKPRYRYYYESEEEGTSRHPRGHDQGGHRRGPPRGSPPPDEVLRLPWTMWMNSNAKNHFVAFIGEFVGTTMFLFFAFSGTQVANIGSSSNSQNTTTGADTGFSPPVLQYIALVFAFSLMVNVWIFFRISGGLFNPAVTFAMLLTRAMTPVRFFLLLVAQISGAIFSSFLVGVMFPTPLNVRTTLSSGTSLARGVFIEAVLTAELVFTIFMLAKEKHKATFIAPVGIGLALFIAELVGVYYTGGSLNPARSFGPCVVTGVFDQEHWIYWVGPGIGAILAVTFYKFIKILEYEMANPDQDASDKDIKEKNYAD